MRVNIEKVSNGWIVTDSTGNGYIFDNGGKALFLAANEMQIECEIVHGTEKYIVEGPF